MEGFGPYVDKTVIDFEDFDRLTLISGPTGSGKTTIFDGICCALFGDPSGARKFSQMHSKNRDVRTRVAFDFELNGKRYHIERSPGYATEERKYNAEALLVLPDGGIVQKSKEATRKIEEILGITKNEFGQIVMIAQNDFMAMLKATSGEQEKTFNRIFGLTLYENFDKKVKKAFDEAKADRALSKERLLTLSEYGTEDPVESLKADLEELENSRKKTVEEREILLKEIDRFYKKKEKALRFKELERQEKDLLAQKDELDESFEQVKAKQERIALLEKVDGFKTDYDKILELKDETDELKTKTAEDEKSLSEVKEKLVENKKKLSDFDQKDLESLKERIAVGESRLDYYKDCDEKKEELEDLRKKAKAQIKRNKELLTRIKTLEGEKIEIVPPEEIVAALYETKNKLEAVKRELVEAETVEEKQKRAKDLEQRLSQGREILLKAKEDYLTTQEDYQKAFELFLEDQAAVLATHLKEGKPCPVCGSTEHPSPKASESHGTVDLKALEEDKNQKRTTYEKQKKDFDILKSEEEELKKSLEQKQLRQVDELLEAKKSLEEEFESLKQKQEINKKNILREDKRKEDLESLKEKLATLKEDYVKVVERGEYLKRELREDVMSYDTAVKKLEELRQELNNKQEALKKLEETEQKLTMDQVRLNEGLRSAGERLREKRKEWMASGHCLKESLRRENLDALTFKKLLSELDELESYRKSVMDFYARLETVTAQLKVLQEKLKNEERISSEGLDEEEAELLDKRAEYERLLERLKIGGEELKDKIKQVKEFYAKYLALDERVNDLGALNDTVNKKGRTFAQFVLSYYFKKILERANKRLYTVSLGRYSLIQPEAGRLGLEIYDGQNNKTREVTTLSGGEMFFTSLSLALGFSEIVEEEYGGVRLDTIFIDEGFGSLDPDHLERAVEVLLNLTGDRKVFVISHVESLKELIDGQIVVEKKKDHSEIRT